MRMNLGYQRWLALSWFSLCINDWYLSNAFLSRTVVWVGSLLEFWLVAGQTRQRCRHKRDWNHKYAWLGTKSQISVLGIKWQAQLCWSCCSRHAGPFQRQVFKMGKAITAYLELPKGNQETVKGIKGLKGLAKWDDKLRCSMPGFLWWTCLI